MRFGNRNSHCLQVHHLLSYEYHGYIPWSAQSSGPQRRPHTTCLQDITVTPSPPKTMPIRVHGARPTRASCVFKPIYQVQHLTLHSRACAASLSPTRLFNMYAPSNLDPRFKFVLTLSCSLDDILTYISIIFNHAGPFFLMCASSHFS
jgi:hypothetical protein